MTEMTDPAGNSIIKGTATIIAGNTDVTVTHTLGNVPSIVFVTPEDVYGQNAYTPSGDWTTTSFKIYIPNAQPVDAVFRQGVS